MGRRRSRTREWDVAYALWRFVPLYEDEACVRLRWPVVDRGPRIAAFLAAYGPLRCDDVLAVVLHRQEVVRATIRAGAAAGDPGYVGLLREGRVAEIEDNMRYVELMRRMWTAAIG